MDEDLLFALSTKGLLQFLEWLQNIVRRCYAYLFFQLIHLSKLKVSNKEQMMAEGSFAETSKSINYVVCDDQE